MEFIAQFCVNVNPLKKMCKRFHQILRSLKKKKCLLLQGIHYLSLFLEKVLSIQNSTHDLEKKSLINSFSIKLCKKSLANKRPPKKEKVFSAANLEEIYDRLNFYHFAVERQSGTGNCFPLTRNHY